MERIDSPEASDGVCAWAAMSPAAEEMVKAGSRPRSLPRSTKPPRVRSTAWDCLDPGMRGADLLWFWGRQDTSIRFGDQ